MVKCKLGLVILFLIVCLQCVFATSKLDYLRKDNFQIGISSVGVNLSTSTNTQCGRELQIFLESVEENKLWALKLIDSFGVIPKGFHWGNYFWYPSKEFCDDLNEPIKIALSDRYHHTNNFNSTSPFAVRFWMIYFNFTSPIYVNFNLEFEHYLHVGLCLPQSCSREEAIHYSQPYFAQKSFELQQRFHIQMDVMDAKSPEFKWSFLYKTGVLISFFFLALNAVLMIIADRIHRNHLQISSKGNQPPANKFLRVEQFFLCFHLQDNFQKIVGIDNSKGFLPVISGLRTIVCIWITLSHVYYYSMFAMSNIPLMISKLEYLISQPLLQACFYVDVFFVISSFLLVYNFLSNCQYMKVVRTNSLKANLVFFLRLVLSRYVRLLPIMVVTVVLADILYDFLDMYSPLRMGEFSPIYCKNNWWYNILFINNFLDFQHMCSSWTWYLGCEMQFFILFTAILFVFAKNESFGKSLFLVVFVAGVAISFLCHYIHGYTFQIDVISTTLGQLYAKPWIRINSYTSGALIGWLFCKRKQTPFKPKGLWKSAFWVFTFCLCLGTSFMSYWRATPTWIVSMIMSFGKLIFALCIGGVIIMCEWGHGGLFNSILTSWPFLILNKLSFCIYMTAPVIIMAVFGLQPEPRELNEVSFLMKAIGISMLSMGVSFFIVWLVELPAENLRSKLLSTKITSKSEKIQCNSDLSSKKDE